MRPVLTAPLALIKMNGVPIGKMKNISATEDINRAPVRGIGRLTLDQVPALTHQGTLNCSSYLIDFNRTIFDNNDLAAAMFRGVQTAQEFADNILLQEVGIQLDIYRKISIGQNNFGVQQAGFETFASISGLFITRESMNISESQISGRDCSFMYTDPIVYPS